MSILPPTTPAFANELLNDTYVNERGVQQAELQLTTGQAINQPSDNPPGTVETLQLQAAQSRVNGYVANASAGMGQLGQAQNALSSALSTLNQVMDTLEGASQAQDSSTGEQADAAQLRSLSSALLQIANTTYDGYAVFGGTSGVKNAFDSSGVYQGNTTVASVTVAAGTQLQTGIVGTDVFGSTVAGSPDSSIFSVINQAASDLASGNLTGAQAAESAVSTYVTQANDAIATVGSLYDQFQQASDAANATLTTLATETANVLDVNVAQVDTTYQADQNSLQASMYAIANVVPESLLQYLP